MKRVPIVFSTDDNYVFPTAVTLVSMMENRKGDIFYEVIILIPEEFSVLNKDIFWDICGRYEGVSIEFIKVAKNIFEKSISRISHISNVAFYRLVIGDILTYYDKCIYMDSDIIVLSDLEEMFQVDISDYYLAGVKNYRHNRKKYIESMDINGDIPAEPGYIMGAPLLLNLKKIRQDNITEKFLEGIRKGFICGDNDVINVCCWGNICFLPLRMNMLSRHLGLEELLIEEGVFSDEEKEAAKNSPMLIHYGGYIEKPWLNVRCKGYRLWWKYAEKLANYDAFYQYKMMAEEWSQSIDWFYMMEKIGKHERICIWGYNSIGEKLVLDLLRRGETVSNLQMADNSPDKQGKSFCGIKVRSADDVLRENAGSATLYIVVSQAKYKEICNQLRQYISQEDIYVYRDKGKEYYMTLDSSYREREIKEILNWEQLKKEQDFVTNSHLVARYYLGLWYFEGKFGDIE